MATVRTHSYSIIDRVQHANLVVQAAQRLTADRRVRIKNLVGSSKAILVAALYQLGEVPMVVLASDDRSSDDWTHDLGVLLREASITTVHRPHASSGRLDLGSLRHDEIDALLKVQHATRSLTVVTSAALGARMPSQQSLAQYQRELHRGLHLPYESFVTELAINGYERVDFVGKPGEMAVRGGIVDLYPAGWDNPLRIEFWGDDVDSIREFEPLSQRSIREHDRAVVLTHVFHDDDEQLTATVLDHLPPDTVIVYDGPPSVEELPILEALKAFPTLEINPLGDTDLTTVTKPQPSVAGSIEQMLQQASALQSSSVHVFLGADGKAAAQRLIELCEGVTDHVEEESEERALGFHRAMNGMEWLSASLSQGCTWNELGIAVWSEHEVFGRQRAQRRSKRSESGITIREIQQLHKGEFVVHTDKGIGQFDGLTTIDINGSQVDCVRLLFAGGDVLYVHLNYVHKLSKFSAEEGSVPKLSKLGTAEWERKKARAKKRIKDIARDLITLYAQRKAQPGYAFPEDTIWQKEFEASFQYEDTADQAKATAEVKADMEQSAPMDRLICGDVGFGKTEIAIRAAFKAAQAGKQVAVLVPTTILAQQHYMTFSDRLRRYPVTIEVLSRFRSKAEQREVLQRLAEGKVDIIIGTHRLLSADVQFRQLGLLIVDEEQRFGVSAKEKLRALRTTVDTLTLTATPIPRTLHFSLMGARDLSVIETPPRNRLPVETEIIEWDDDLLREALQRECDRGGQTFIVTDKIHDMEQLITRIRMLAPTLRITMAHGQLPTEELEDVMEAFLERKYDVLVATKIIESGLDIPNANTMIVYRADNFGLAELYQLRGRVGRSNVQAYCYLLIPPVHTISRIALRRLQALEEFTDLGSGFQLAMRDLELRGAGNLLGGEQSGFIMDMGFELYHKILDEAVDELRTEEFHELFGTSTARQRRPSFINEDVAIELDVDALLPKSWIPNDTDRYEAYKTLYNATRDADADAVFADLRDRFGALPADAEHLWYAVRLRIAALPTGFVRLRLQHTSLSIELPPESQTTYYETAFQRILSWMADKPNIRFVQHGKRLLLEVELARRDDAINVVSSIAAAILAEEAL